MITQLLDEEKMRVANEKAKARAKIACNELGAMGIDATWLLGAAYNPSLFFVILTENREINAHTQSVLKKYRLDYEFYEDTAVAKVYGY